VLTDVAEMARSALLHVNLEAQAHSSLSALLSWGASIFEGIGEPLELSLMLALTYLSVYSRTMSRFKTSLAPAAHEDATHRVMAGVEAIVPLVIFWLLSRVPLPLPDLGQTSESEW
jgi:hypothetical protein